MDEIIKRMVGETDLNPWYWRSVGEKCYAFDVVEAFPMKRGVEYPDPGSELDYGEDGEWYGNNGIKMLVNSIIASIDQQNGDTICKFIAKSHAYFFKNNLPKISE